jgi:hypothetical protein
MSDEAAQEIVRGIGRFKTDRHATNNCEVVFSEIACDPC